MDKELAGESQRPAGTDGMDDLTVLAPLASGLQTAQEPQRPGSEDVAWSDPEVTVETARALLVPRSCEACGTPLVGGRPQRRHCNGACRARVSRTRKEQALRNLVEQFSKLLPGSEDASHAKPLETSAPRVPARPSAPRCT